MLMDSSKQLAAACETDQSAAVMPTPINRGHVTVAHQSSLHQSCAVSHSSSEPTKHDDNPLPYSLWERRPPAKFPVKVPECRVTLPNISSYSVTLVIQTPCSKTNLAADGSQSL
jgi:hypothetical protein